ncbi:MAG: CCA tRNA nucleotidyltransferase [Candidatus Dormibacteria bacterium]
MSSRRIQHTPDVDRAAAAIEKAASRLKTRAFMVGGYVRDALLQRPGKDIDVVVEGGMGSALAELLVKDAHARNLVVFPRFGTAELSFEDLVLQFVSARSESYAGDSRKPSVRPASLEEDMRRRDFTVNALMCGADGEVLDLTGQGLADLDAAILRTPLPAAETFAEDPLRAVRAVRFAVALDFSMDDQIPPAIAANLDRLQTVVSVERVNEELRRMVLGPRPGDAVRLLVETGIGARILPEIVAMSGVRQSGFHNLDVMDHTLAAMNHLARRGGPHLAQPLELRARLGMLFHDSGKPATADADADGDKITFYGHPDIGADVAFAALRRLRFSGDEVDDVARLVSMHMRPIQYQPDWGEGAIRRLVRDCGALLPALMVIAEGDMAASDYPVADAVEKMTDLRRRVATVEDDVSHAARSPLDGHSLMQHFGRPGGPWVKVIQDALVDAILDGALPAGDAQAAWSYIDRHPELVAS